MGILLEGRLTKVEAREASGAFPSSWSVVVLDPQEGETLRLSASKEVADALSGVPEFAPVVLRVKLWQVQAERGGVAYKPKAVAVEKRGGVATRTPETAAAS